MAAKWKAPDNFSGFVKELVKEVGKKAGKADVVSKATELHGEEAGKWVSEQKGLSVAINNANKFHEFVKEDEGGNEDGKTPSPEDYLKAIGIVKGLVKELKEPERVINEVASLVETLGSAANVKKLVEALTK